MSFWAREFAFDGISSSMYDLVITSEGLGGSSHESSDSGNNDIQLYTESIYRRPVEYLYGVQQTPVLEFTATVTSPSMLTSVDAELVQSWLFGQMNYKKLQIMQNDMQDVYFNCFLTQPKILRSGNFIRGFDFTVHCDSPWAWTFPKTISLTNNFNGNTFAFHNQSNSAYYLYPKLDILLTGGTDKGVKITNITDNGRVFQLYGSIANPRNYVNPYEGFTIDNDKQIFQAYSGATFTNNKLNISNAILSPGRLDIFNCNWLRFVPGQNLLIAEGNISNVSMTYQFARKIGG